MTAPETALSARLSAHLRCAGAAPARGLRPGPRVSTTRSTKRGQDGSSVQARLYSSTGAALSDQVQVNVYTTSAQSRSAVAAAADGRFVVTWGDGGAFSGGQDGDGYGIFARTIGSDGMPAGDEFQVNAYTTFSQRIPGVACAGDDFVVVWQGTGAAEGRQIFGRRLSPDLVFADGFESGDLSGWSGSLP